MGARSAGGTTSAYGFGANAEALDEYAWSFDNSGLEALW